MAIPAHMHTKPKICACGYMLRLRVYVTVRRKREEEGNISALMNCCLHHQINLDCLTSYFSYLKIQLFHISSKTIS